MSDNKFILRLKGQQTPESVVEIKNDKLVAPFEKVPHSTDVVGGIIDDKDSSVVVAKGAQNWKLDGTSLVVANTLFGNGEDYTGEYDASGAGLWVNSTYTFPTTGDVKHPIAEIFNANTKWVLKLCGKNLFSTNKKTVDFTLVVKIGTSNITSKTFTIATGANTFCRKFIIDFSESEQSLIKVQGGTKLTLQLLCSDSGASATIYNGMTVLSVLQRRVDASAVSSSFANVEEVMRSGLLPNDFFNNAEYIEEIMDGGTAFPIFIRRGDEMVFSGWRDNKHKKYIFVITAGQTTLTFEESIENQNVDLYWNGQLLQQQGNWTASDDTITMLFDAEEGDVVVVMTNATTEVLDYVTLTSHNTDLNAHANLMAAHNADLGAHSNLVAQILTSNIDCGTL